MNAEEKQRIEARLRSREEITADERKSLEDDLAVELSNAVYVAAHVYEHCENLGLLHGNGHHMAQDISNKAVMLLRERFELEAQARARKAPVKGAPYTVAELTSKHGRSECPRCHESVCGEIPCPKCGGY